MYAPRNGETGSVAEKKRKDDVKGSVHKESEVGIYHTVVAP